MSNSLRTMRLLLSLLLLLIIGTSFLAVPQRAIAYTPSMGGHISPQGDPVKDDVKVLTTLRLVPTDRVHPGDTLIIEIYVENSGVDRSSKVYVDLFYEEYQLEILDTRFDRRSDSMTRNDYERPEITFGKLKGGEHTKAQIITRVREDLPPGSMVYVWAEWQWDYDEYNLWDIRTVERRFKEATREVRVPVVRPETPSGIIAEPIGFVYNIGQPQSMQQCFPETGYCIGGRIRQFWEYHGGLPIFGFPVGPQKTAEIEGIPLQVQWFERTRLEIHPETPPPHDVVLGRVGTELLAQHGVEWRMFPKSAPHPECHYFPETGHNVCGDIWTQWRSHGLELDGIAGTSMQESLALYGLPLSDILLETLSDGNQYPVQWFERARIELHPKNFPPYHVMNGLLGRELIEGR